MNPNGTATPLSPVGASVTVNQGPAGAGLVQLTAIQPGTPTRVATVSMTPQQARVQATELLYHASLAEGHEWTPETIAEVQGGYDLVGTIDADRKRQATYAASAAKVAALAKEVEAEAEDVVGATGGVYGGGAHATGVSGLADAHPGGVYGTRNP